VPSLLLVNRPFGVETTTFLAVLPCFHEPWPVLYGDWRKNYHMVGL